jgi:oxygen-independent coproporphyrinogen-3 oxidase
VPSRNEDIGPKYLESLLTEARLVRELLPRDIRLAALHLGGGTPTFLRPVQLDGLLGVLGRLYDLTAAAEIAVELDPRVTTEEHLDVMRSRGVSRISLGVQDTSFEVQAAIGRFQSREVTRRFFDLCRRKGFESINVDLVYGLPLQTMERFERTLEDVTALRPERLAVFGYAHVPWVRSNQRGIHPEDLPTATERIELSLAAHQRFAEAGYVHIGLDHFALPGDELATAQAEGRLGRTFMGYTPHRGLKGIGLGVSSIGELGPGYFQNHKKLADYFARLEAGDPPIERGYLLGPDDEMRRHVIQEILCNLRLDYQRFTRRFGRVVADVLGPELASLGALQQDGLIERRAEALLVTPVGRLFLRNIAAVFDAYLASAAPEVPVYSRTV